MRRSTERGLALALVLWSLLLLTTIGIGFSYAVRVETAGATALSEQVRAEAVAAAGVRRAIAALLAEDTRLRWATNGAVREILWPEAILRTSVRPENAKIDLNAAPRELLMGLFANLLPESDAEGLADAVLLQRGGAEAEAEAQRRPAARDRGDRRAERPLDRQNARPFDRRGDRSARPARSAPRVFLTVDELVQVPGFDAVGVQRLRPYLTVHGSNAKVDAATADVEVLAAVPGVTRDSAERFVQERTTLAADRDRPAGAALDLSSLGAATGYLETGVKAPVINIRALARLQSGATGTVEAVLTLDGESGYTLLEWREGTAGLGPGWGLP